MSQRSGQTTLGVGEGVREREHRRYYRVAGITIGVTSDVPFAEETFRPKIEAFRVEGPGDDTVTLHHAVGLPTLAESDCGVEVYRRPPWAISRRGDEWVYREYVEEREGRSVHKIAVFDGRHARGTIHHADSSVIAGGKLGSLTTFPTDQILLGRLLADREGCLVHACGAILDGQGLLFVGHSGAGKTTMVTMLRETAEVLCDDRIAVRRCREGFRIHGTWSHGEAPDVSPASAPLRAVFFLGKAGENRVAPLPERRAPLGRLLSCLIRPLETRDWWVPTLDVVGRIAREVPAFDLAFDKSGGVVPLLEEMVDAWKTPGAPRP